MATSSIIAGVASLPQRSIADDGWNPGIVSHLIPAASHERFALKASFAERIDELPLLHVGGRSVAGVPTDSANRFFSFDVDGLEPDVEYALRLTDAGNSNLCDEWPLRTFPAPDAAREHVRIVAYTCAGGHPGDADWFLPIEVRRRLLRRALSFAPQAIIAIGDHIYWDQRTELENRGETYGERVRRFYESVGWLDRTMPALGTRNEISLKAAIGPQIGELYGTLLRSTPSYFVSDDHDYFENDDADPNMVTFPPDVYQLEFARFARNAFLPEFLPDPNRPLMMSGTGAGDRAPGISEAFGTFRYGRLVETLIYDCARYLSLKGDHAGLVPPEVERWLLARTADQSVAQLLHVPSHPFGWSAGKWGEWYPDVADTGDNEAPEIAQCCDAGDRRVVLTTERDKFLWQRGWWLQHQRLLQSLNAQQKRAGVVLSGDLHAISHATLQKSADLDLSQNPVHTVLTGTLGTQNGWPSDARGTPPLAAIGLVHESRGAVQEKNGFTVLDIAPDAIDVSLYAWKTGEPLSAIDTLQPYHRAVIDRRAAA